MADEQNWADYANQATLAGTDTILARTAAGAGVEVPGTSFALRDPYGCLRGGIGASSTTAGVSSDWNHASNIVSGQNPRLLLSSDANGPANEGSQYFHAFNFEYSSKDGSGNVSQLAIPYALLPHNNLCFRTRYNDTWSSWRHILMENESGAFIPNTDNSKALGNSSKRFSVVYAATGSINTSDEREKTWRGEITDSEYQAGLAVLDNIGFYQWNDSVEEKGANAARYHFGARAQRVWSIFADHGLAPAIGEDGLPFGDITAPALLCFDQWQEQREPIFETVDGEQIDTGKTRVTQEAGNRYGFRIDQLNTFLIAVMHRRQTAIEARLAALEG